MAGISESEPCQTQGKGGRTSFPVFPLDVLYRNSELFLNG